MKVFKPVFSIFLAAIYAFLSIGAGLQAHYCHGNLASVSVISYDIGCECEDYGATDCCTTEQAVFQFDQQQHINQDFSFRFISTAPNNPFLYKTPDLFKNDSFINEEEIPPSNSSPPQYLLNSSFLFYG
ncbi:MAG: hypothetical protein RIC15_04840 [Vicingaceae bacterium]